MHECWHERGGVVKELNVGYRSRLWPGGSSTLTLVVVLTACTGLAPSNARPEAVFTPDIAGPISDGSFDAATGTYTLTVAGETFNIGPDALGLEGDAPGGSGVLLLFGADDGTSWYVNVPRVSTGSQADCYLLSTANAWDAGDSILFGFPLHTDEGVDKGVLLQKAETWADAWDESIELASDARFPVQFQAWCLDRAGRVESVEERAAG